MRSLAIALAAAVAVLAKPVVAADDKRDARPYRPIAVTVAAPREPAGLATFRAELAALAASREMPQLAARVLTKGFFYDGEGGAEKRPGFEQLVAGLAFDQGQGDLGWSNLVRLSAQPAAPHERRRGVHCSPPLPRYDRKALARLLGDTESESNEWAAPRAAGLTVRLQPRDNGDPVETLGSHLVLVDGAEAPSATDTRAWSLVMTPSGKRGYVLASDLIFLGGDRLCYAKDADGKWRIAGYIASVD